MMKLKGVRKINYQDKKIESFEVNDQFDEYVERLILELKHNVTSKKYVSTSPNTEVISRVKEIINEQKEDLLVSEQMDKIATRLLNKQIEAQEKVSAMNINVQKGSLIQALFFDEVANENLYLLALAEHSEFIDDSDYSLKSGFEKDKIKTWKSCILHFPLEGGDVDHATEYHADVHFDNMAKYWDVGFLELKEIHSDQYNTKSAYKHIESTLNRKIKKKAPRDHMVLSNAMACKFMQDKFIDYDALIDDVFNDYQAISLDEKELEKLKETLKTLPEINDFDRQFRPDPNSIRKKFAKKYDVNQGIELKVKEGIPGVENMIVSEKDQNGTMYLKIETNDESLYKMFKNDQSHK